MTNTYPTQYALYQPTVDRFLTISYDWAQAQWLMKLISSRYMLFLCVINQDLNINDSNCYLYTATNFQRMVNVCSIENWLDEIQVEQISLATKQVEFCSIDHERVWIDFLKYWIDFLMFIDQQMPIPLDSIPNCVSDDVLKNHLTGHTRTELEELTNACCEIKRCLYTGLSVDQTTQQIKSSIEKTALTKELYTQWINQ